MIATPPAERGKPELILPVFQHLSEVGATGEATPFIRYLKTDALERQRLVRERVEQWLGKNPGEKNDAYRVTREDGLLSLSVSGLNVKSLAPLRGLPLDFLALSGCSVTDLEPLRGMRLVKLHITRNPITDLSPLEGMPLNVLTMDHVNVTDLSPLAEMSLKYLQMSYCRLITDLSPLRGAPLQTLIAYDCQAEDYSPLRGMPLRKLVLRRSTFRDCTILQGMPLETLELPGRVSDLSPLAGLPLRALLIDKKTTASLEPLLRVSALERLTVTAPIENVLPLRHHPALKSINHNDSGLRPVAEFWADYDAQQAAGKK